MSRAALAAEHEPSPREIVAALHTVIAAISPEHEALVAAFEALPPRATPRRPAQASTAALIKAVRERKDERMGSYARLRESGLGKKAAARRAGISVRTVSRYEQDMSPAPEGSS